MLGRVWSLGIVAFWTAAMGWLFWKDVLPMWSAQEPPRAVTPDWISGRDRQQARIEDKHGERIGTMWTLYRRAEGTIVREDVILIRRFPVLAPARMEIESVFDAQGLLDELTATLSAHGLLVNLHGERYASQFAFQLTAGTFHQTFRMDGSDAGTFGDLFKPFSAMPDLKVGQTWRMQVFNPVAAATGYGDKFLSMLVRVTGTEVVLTPDGPVPCMLVEGPHALAKVAADGTVWVQEVDLPIGGRIVIRAESFDEASLRQAKSLSLLTGGDAG